MNDFDRAEMEHELQDQIKVTGIDLIALVKKAYDLSSPAGMGFLHYRPEPLTDEQAATLVRNDDKWFPVNLDYVAGRAVKLTVFRKNSELFVDRSWFDHTEAQFRELLAHVGVTPPPGALKTGLRR